MSRRQALQLAAAGAASAAFPAILRGADPGRKPPDVLFLILEDVSPERFGCYGNKVCRTPHIDRLASRGVRFDQCHTSPPCSPSRTALLTGMRPETTGIFDNSAGSVVEEVKKNFTYLPERFAAAGYETVRLGKIGHPDKPESWARQVEVKRAQTPEKPPVSVHPEGFKPIGAAFEYGPSGRADEEDFDGALATAAIGVLREKRDRPLFLAAGFHADHLAFRAPDKYFAMYPPEEMEIPKNPGSAPDGMPSPEQWEKLRAQFQFAPMGPNNPHTVRQWKEAIAAHYACLTYVDAQIGRILDALEESGRADNTVVVLWSDHGFILGEHFLWRKGPLIRQSTQCALVVRAPGVGKAGGVAAGPVDAMDIHPTLLELCGLPVPPELECTSFRPLLERPERPWKKASLVCGGKNHRGLVNGRWRYSESTGDEPGKELFDLAADPGEFNNMAGDPAHAAAQAELAGLLAGGWKACLPDAAR